MLATLAVENYRSLHALTMPLSRLTVVTGADGVGKSNLYGALRLLVTAARGDVVAALAREGSLATVMRAGLETISRSMQKGQIPVQGGPRQKPARVRLGSGSEDFGFLIELGLPEPLAGSQFNLDPVIQHESIWHSAAWHRAAVLVERTGPLLRRNGHTWEVVATGLAQHDSLFSHAGDPATVLEVFQLRETLRQWRCYAGFRSDAEAAARGSITATRTPVLHHDEGDLAAALQTLWRLVILMRCTMHFPALPSLSRQGVLVSCRRICSSLACCAPWGVLNGRMAHCATCCWWLPC